MNKTATKAFTDGGRVIYRTNVFSDDCILNSPEARYIKMELIRYIIEDMSFSACGGRDFEKMKMFHDGLRWVIQFEALEESKMDESKD